MDLSYPLNSWVSNVQAGRASGRKLGPGHFHEVRYEALIDDPPQTLHEVCTFLGVSFAPVLLDYGETTSLEGKIAYGRSDPQAALHSDSIGRWQREMTLFERQLAQSVAGPLLVELGYPADNDLPPPATADRFRMVWLSIRYHALDLLRSVLYRLGMRSLSFQRRKR